MGKLSQQFSEFRKTTPKYIQWVLMGAAFIVIVVLIVLLATGKKKTPAIEVIGEETENVSPELVFDPADANFDWSKTAVGETQTGNIEVRANTSIKVTDVKISIKNEDNKKIGISADETCSNDQMVINQDVSCAITIKYEPTATLKSATGEVVITWHPWTDEERVETSVAGKISLGATGKATPTKDSEPTTAPVETPATSEQETTEEPVEDASTPAEPTEVIETIAPSIDFDEIPEPATEETPEVTSDDDEVETTEEDEEDAEEVIETIAPKVELDEKPAPAKKVAAQQPAKKEHKKISLGTACSDFAFPAYDMQGVQSGWIKPSGGAYYYHPFEDKKCETPAGRYNPSTGYIMDLDDPSKKIGSDVDHIRASFQDKMPSLTSRTPARTVNRATQSDEPTEAEGGSGHINMAEPRVKRNFTGSAGDTVFNSEPYDRTFLLRQYKPIPATIVSDIQADKELLKSGIPVRATVDRNVYSDNGRTVILPTGTMMLGYVTGELPGPYKAVGRMEIKWYQFIRPDGTEFNFSGNEPFSADAQGRKGVPGHGSTDYLQQFVLPMFTAIVPAAVNMIAPIADRFVNQIDLDNNTVVQSGTVRSSEMAKNEIINAWNTVASKLMVDMMDNTIPPFTIAAGTRITVFSPVDLAVTCGDPSAEGETRKCAIAPFGDTGRQTHEHDAEESQNTEEFIGQVRSLMFNSLTEQYCEDDEKSGTRRAKLDLSQEELKKAGFNFQTLDFYCRSMGTYQAKNNARQEVLWQNQKDTYEDKVGGAKGSQTYNENVLGLVYEEDGTIKNPFEKVKPAEAEPEADAALTCDGGSAPDKNGCCPGETYTDMGDAGMNCCPDSGGDCFPPIPM